MCVVFKLRKIQVSVSPESFSLKLIHGLGFYDDLNFLKNVCKGFSCRKFEGIELNNSL